MGRDLAIKARHFPAKVLAPLLCFDAGSIVLNWEEEAGCSGPVVGGDDPTTFAKKIAPSALTADGAIIQLKASL